MRPLSIINQSAINRPPRRPKRKLPNQDAFITLPLDQANLFGATLNACMNTLGEDHADLRLCASGVLTSLRQHVDNAKVPPLNPMLAQFEAFTTFLRTRRKAQRLTQAEVALRIGIKADHYAKIERGECRMQEHHRPRLAVALGIPVGDLLPHDPLSRVSPSQPWKTMRLRVGMTQSEVCQRTGLKQSRYSEIERGLRHPSNLENDTLLQILQGASPSAIAANLKPHERMRTMREAMALTRKEAARLFNIQHGSYTPLELGTHPVRGWYLDLMSAAHRQYLEANRNVAQPAPLDVDNLDVYPLIHPDGRITPTRRARLSLGLEEAKVARDLGMTLLSYRLYESGKARVQKVLEKRIYHYLNPQVPWGEVPVGDFRFTDFET